jgi:hypothetical protein
VTALDANEDETGIGDSSTEEDTFNILAAWIFGRRRGLGLIVGLSGESETGKASLRGHRGRRLGLILRGEQAGLPLLPILVPVPLHGSSRHYQEDTGR